MILFKMIKLKLGGKIYSELAISLGYQNHTTAINRLHMIEATKSTYEWLKSSSYDLKYSNEEFLVKLCKLLIISPISHEIAIKKAKYRLSDFEKMQQPYIFINTNFKRKNETLISLASLHRKRILALDKERYLYTREKEFLDIVSLQIKEHHKRYKGRLDLWGKIENYIFYDRHRVSHTFDIDGVKISEQFEDLFHYMAKFKFEHDTEYSEFSETDQHLLFSMIFDDIRNNLTNIDAKYINRISSLKPTLFDMENIEKQFVDNTKGLFYLESYSVLIYIESKNKTFFIHYMPIFGYRLEDFVDKNRLYKNLHTHLQILTSKEELFEDKKWTQIPHGDNMTKLLKKACVDYFYDSLSKHNLSSGEACKLLQQLHDNAFITTQEFINYLMRFGQLDFDLGNTFRYQRIAKQISRVLDKPEERTYTHVKNIIATFKDASTSNKHSNTQPHSPHPH